MAAKKTNDVPENFDLYSKLMAAVSEIEVRGATLRYTSMNGNMYSLLKDGVVALRLPAKEREEFIKKYKSSLYEAYGAVMREYVTISEKLLKKTKELEPYVISSYNYAKTLKAKPTKKGKK
jgi:TfoX/Sxy family transcriptional regulator of competence genes